jgi:S-formylglutathione hydrolase FrmB
MRLLFFIVLISFFAACESIQKQEVEAAAAPVPALIPDTMPLPKGIDSFMTLNIAGHAVDIAPPDSGVAYRGNLIILQGYNFPKHDWCQKAPELCRRARAEGYLLIMPEMGRSLYSSAFFAETRNDMKKYPLRTWLVDSVFSYLNERHNILQARQNNYILGLSTGAHGAALIALDRPNLFNAIAALSGDYDQTKIPNDPLIVMYYGNYKDNTKRWTEVDNVLWQIKKWNTPIYLGHGQMDKVVPPAQTRLFYDSLLLHFDNAKVQLNEPKTMAHDYKYWGSETEAVLQFFKKFQQN